MSLSYLRSVMVGESKAYGFTIAFWGSGIMLVGSFGMPGLRQALLFGFGAVIGFGVLALLAFKGSRETEKDGNPNLLVFSTVHYLSALIPIAVTFFLTQNFSSVQAFFLAGMNVSIFYNLLMVVERKLADEGLALEKRIESLLD